MMLYMPVILLFLMLNQDPDPLSGARMNFREVARFKAAEAHQGVAVDGQYFYAVADREFGKYDKQTGAPAARWEDPEGGPVIHLDSGVICEGKLVCAHSNYPGVPMTSSVEIWDASTLEHIGTHSFGIDHGSLTWVDRYDGFWWAAFAHYNKLSDKTGTDNSYTTLVRFDDRWIEQEAWIYPEVLLQRFDGMSNSGGSWGPDGRLYLTGHDRAELYAVRLPSAGSELVLEEVIPIAVKGQGIAWDRSQPGHLYAISRAEREVIVFASQP